MRHYELLPHTADVRLSVEGDTLPELFSAALEGMTEILKGAKRDEREGKSVFREFSLAARDATALLVDFLSYVLTLSHEERAVFRRVEFQYLTATTLTAKIVGVPIHSFDEDIKAVTYHEAQIIKNERGNYETVIVFDI